LRALLFRGFLLLSLFLSGIVPAGMMRQADEGGMRLVLCTGEGIQEVWLTPDGETRPVTPAETNDAAHKQHCIQVNLAFGEVQPQNVAGLLQVAQPVEFTTSTHQTLKRLNATTAGEPRAPPVLL
tara:strand:+ start:47982 stop:48356 length:375 start_codon:yes stop_codon:yes gene_type:complete